jgi:hypothetical protein
MPLAVSNMKKSLLNFRRLLNIVETRFPFRLSERESTELRRGFYILLITASVTPVKEKPPS